jgi:hypothetical protein
VDFRFAEQMAAVLYEEQIVTQRKARGASLRGTNRGWFGLRPGEARFIPDATGLGRLPD